MNTYLAHHGILGQKWGVRRYQNADGTLTKAGKQRYDTLVKERDDMKATAKEGAKLTGQSAALTAGAAAANVALYTLGFINPGLLLALPAGAVFTAVSAATTAAATAKAAVDDMQIKEFRRAMKNV